jgi:hypothetical protein
LEEHPEIDWYKPSRQRLMIHAGQLLRAVKAGDRRTFGRLDRNPEVAQAFSEEQERRMDEIRDEKRRRG